MWGVDEEVAPSVWEALLELVLRFGVCASCHFVPALEGGLPDLPWRCPQCGFMSCNDPESWGPVSRRLDPIGADEPKLDGSPEPDEEDDVDLDVWEPEFPIPFTR